MEQVEAERVCPSCGNRNSPEARYCSACGAALGSTPPVETVIDITAGDAEVVGESWRHEAPGWVSTRVVVSRGGRGVCLLLLLTPLLLLACTCVLVWMLVNGLADTSWLV